jgi:hypothetical protein
MLMEFGMICGYCGQENEEGSEICAFCGEELRMDDEPSLVGEVGQMKVEEKDHGGGTSIPDGSGGGGTKTFIAIMGCGFLLIAMITVASYFLFKDLLTSVSDWLEKRPTSVAISQPTLVATTQPTSMATIQPTSIATTLPTLMAMTQPTSMATSRPSSMATTQPTAIHTTQPTSIYQTPSKLENLFFGIRSDMAYRPYQSIGILKLDSLEQEIIVGDSNGLLPIMMRPETGQGFISPDRKSLALSSGYSQGELLIFRMGNLEPFFRIEGYPELGQFHSFSPDGKFFSFPLRDTQTFEFTLNFLGLENGDLYQQAGLIYGIFLPSSDLAIGFRLSPSEERVISLEKIDFLNNQTTSLLDLDLSLDDITYIPPFLSQDGNLVFFVDGDSLMSFSLQNGEVKTIYKFEYVYEARAFPLHQCDAIVIVDGKDPELVNLILYHPQTDQLVKIDSGVSFEAFYFDQRDFVNVPTVAISPDGSLIAYPVGLINEMELRIAELDGGEVIPLSEGFYFISFKFSPDHQKIAYIGFEVTSEYGDLYITDIHGKERRLLDNNVISFEFISNGADIVYSKFESPEEVLSRSSVYRIGVDGGEKEYLLDEAGAFLFIHVP